MNMVYYVFYCISYSTESSLNRAAKISNQLLIFGHTILLTLALFNHADPKQKELGYLTIFIVVTLTVLNAVVTLNPIQREESVDI